MSDFFLQVFEYLKELTPLLGVLLIVLLSAEKMSDFFKKINLPGITGVLLTGILIGPHVLKLIDSHQLEDLHFLNEVALSFIALYAGTELYLKEIQDRIKKIIVDTAFLTISIFTIGVLAVYNLQSFIPFMVGEPESSKLAISILFATIFIARSPSSALAIMRELRAKGPFVKSTIGVTVIIDFLVIVLFSITFAFALNLTKGESINLIFLLDLLIELALSLLIGYLLSVIISLIFKSSISKIFKSASILFLGYGTYMLSHYIGEQSALYLPFNLHVETLLICIIASFRITNYTSHRKEFHEVLHTMSPFIYVMFFTLTGAHLAIDYFAKVWLIALMLFLVRLTAIFVGTFSSAMVNKEGLKYAATSWTGFVTQAGVGIGLATVVADNFPKWGYEFYTLVLSIIVLNEIVGPALFKFGIKKMGESHLKHSIPEHTGTRDALIFGYEPQSVSLSKQLESHNWDAKIVCAGNDAKQQVPEKMDNIEFLEEFNLEGLKALECDKKEAVVLMLSDDENYKLAELIYENVGTKEVIVRLNKRENFDKFHELGALVVNPETALVGLLDSFVRSPNATSLLLGTEDDGNISMDIEITDDNIHGQQIKFLRLPDDVIIISVKRKGQLIISHGYTRLKVGDIISVIGSQQSLEDVMLLVSV